MRIRTVKPEFFRDPDSTGRWPADLRLFYLGTWLLADDDGRLALDVDLIAADLYPFDRSVDVASLVDRLVASGHLVPYEVGGRRYGWLPKFRKHQRINRPTESKLPPPPASLTEGSVSAPGGLTPGREGKGREGNGSECAAHAAAPPEVVDPEPLLLTSPEVEAPSRHSVVKARLLDAFAEVRGGRHPWSGKEAGALERLLKLEADDDEIVRRWRAGLQAQGFHRVDSLADLGRAEKWNAYARPVAAVTASDRDRERVAKLDARAKECPAWGEVLRALVEQGARGEWLDRWILPLRARVQSDGSLLLAAPDDGHAEFTRDHVVPLVVPLVGDRAVVVGTPERRAA